MHPPPKTVQYFDDLPLDRRSLWALDRIGYEKPTPIQAAFIPVAVTGRDCIGQAQTGTGKTAAFVLPILQAIHSDIQDPQALVLAPTRELAAQIQAEAERLSHGRGLHLITLCGGHSMHQQIQELRWGCQIAVGTPGRVMHHLRTGELRVHEIRHVVLDEADRMLDIGFRPDIEKILRQLPRDRQTMLLSATMEPPVRRLAQRYMQDPIMVEVPSERLTVDTIRQSYFTVDMDRKYPLLLRLIDRDRPTRCIVFCRRKRDADALALDLSRDQQSVHAMHGDLDQNKRNRTLDAFRSGKIRFLISTDLVGRGIDVDDISHVINYDIPEDPENYVHRIGRTARMGKDGIAVTFVTPQQADELTAIEMLINHVIASDHIQGYEAFRRKSEPTRSGGPRMDFGHGRDLLPAARAGHAGPARASEAQHREAAHAPDAARGEGKRHREEAAPERREETRRESRDTGTTSHRHAPHREPEPPPPPPAAPRRAPPRRRRAKRR